jgi:hypothetical protein
MKKPKPRLDNRTRLGPIALALVEEMCGPGAPTQNRLDGAIRGLQARVKTANDVADVEASVDALRDDCYEAQQRLLNGINLTRFVLEGLSDGIYGEALGDVIARLNDRTDEHVKPVELSRSEVENGRF